MLKIDLSLKVAIHLGQGKINYIPPIPNNNMPVHYIHSKGGEERNFKDGQSIMDEMEVGSELEQAIHQQNLEIGRISDSYSLDLLDLFNTKKRVSAFMVVWIVSKQNISKRATLVMHGAKVDAFARFKLKGKNVEVVRFVYKSKHASISYGTNIEILMQQELNRSLDIIGSVLNDVFK